MANVPPLPSSPLPSPNAPPAAFVWRTLTTTEWRLLWLVLTLFLFRNLPWRLDDYDQAKQAFSSLEAVQAGHWWFQHTPGYRLVATKPPFIGWISAGFYGLLGGNWEFAWRLPSFLAALAILVLLWRGGEREWPRWGGALAAAAFGLNLLTPRLATLVRTDMPLTLWITAVGLIVWRQARENLPWTDRERWLVFGVLLAAMMTKGPIIYAFILPGQIAHWWVCRRRGVPSHVWGGWWHWALPLIPFVIWLERGVVTAPGFSEQVIGKEFLGRFTVGEGATHRNQPIYFYFAQLLGRWMPWSALLLAVRFGAPGVWRRMLEKPGTLWLICWAAGGLIFMSLVPSKRVDRIFPVIPPLCLILTALLARVDSRWALRWRGWALAAGAAVAAIGAVFSVTQAYQRQEGAYADFGASVRRATAGQRVELVAIEESRRDAKARRKPAAKTDSSEDGDDETKTADNETMLLYLRRLEPFSQTDIVQRLSTGQVDALVMSEPTLERTRGLLAPFGPWRTELTSKGKPRFVLIRRETPVPR
jgi:4-amino-4-deoxy-L-arabinose transferase-like glycosyltransferase